jgi:hypothetical protein
VAAGGMASHTNLVRPLETHDSPLKSLAIGRVEFAEKRAPLRLLLRRVALSKDREQLCLLRLAALSGLLRGLDLGRVCGNVENSRCRRVGDCRNPLAE